ncbi:unnamed protein product [Durusdinium trenchii]|uniref:Transmembrane protein 231 n=1 Tax=Durusdinium trenchii TaxID=1381693 RepID=A0ABP0KWB4_9DINO
MFRPALLFLGVHLLHGERLPVNQPDLEEVSGSPSPQGLLQTREESQQSGTQQKLRTAPRRIGRSRRQRFQTRQRHRQTSRRKREKGFVGTADLQRISKAEKRQRLFGRHTSQAEYVSRARAVSGANSSHRRWDLVGGPDAGMSDDPEPDVGDRYARLTDEQRKQIKLLEQELDSDVPPNHTGLLGPMAEQPMLMAVAGGIGASVGNTGSINFDRDLIRRMKMQDLVVMCLLLFVYFATLSFSACLAHRQAANRSRVKFYADPRMFINTADQDGEDAFLEAFNQQPKQVHLRVTGYLPVANNFPGSFFWRDGLYAVAFSFALDLTPWVARGTPENTDTDDEDSPEVGVASEDYAQLQKFLANNTNDLSIVQVRKHIQWQCWDELAMNIKHQIRQSGFEGVLSIDRTETEEMCVYKNTQWANFMHGKALKVLLALSVVGWIFYVPYMWMRCTYLPIRCAHHINISIGDYWQHIAEGLSANGFLAGDGPQIVFPAQQAARQDSSDDVDSE